MRVVSLLPSATELLCAVVGGDLLVGRSHECDFPPSITRLPALTGQRIHQPTAAAIDAQVRASLTSGQSLYTLDDDLLAALKPDVILTQDLCEVCSIDVNTVRAVASTLDPQPRIVSLNPATIEDVFDDLLTVGEAVGRAGQAEAALVELRERYWTAVDHVNPYATGPEVAFLEWMDPVFIGGHWTPGLIEAAGGRHSLNPAGAKSRRVTHEEMVAAQPQRIIICPCGWDMARSRAELHVLESQRWWNTLPAVIERQVVLVDGNQMFNRPGPRLVDAFRWLVGWINDREELVPTAFPVAPVSA
jgi:iron complex transport system substrate-binding protein